MLFNLLAFSLLTIFSTHSSPTTSKFAISNTIINQTSNQFVSYTVDTVQLVNTGDIDFSDPDLIYLANRLSPAILRVGGTQADYTYYQVPGSSQDPCKLPPGRYKCLDMGRLVDLLTFTKNVDAQLIFGLSIGYPLYPNMSTPSWDDTNSKSLLNWLKSNKYDEIIYGLELGNEVNKDVEPQFQVNAFKKLLSDLNDMYGTNNYPYKLYGPDPHSYTLRENTEDFDWIVDFVKGACDFIDGITYHSYVNQNQSQIFTIDGISEQFTESSRMSNIWTNSFFETASENCKELVNNVNAGEIAEHNQGGIDGVTDTYWDGFWYLDALGSLARLGHASFMRQTFTHSTYGLIGQDSDNHWKTPLPDWYTAFFWTAMMDVSVLDTVSKDNEYLRVYGHCARSTLLKSPYINEFFASSDRNGLVFDNPVAVAFVNIDKNSEGVRIEWDRSSLGVDSSDVFAYAFTSGDGNNLYTGKVNLNGDVLSYVEGSNSLPAMYGENLGGSATNFVAPQYSYGFLLFPQTAISACK